MFASLEQATQKSPHGAGSQWPRGRKGSEMSQEKDSQESSSRDIKLSLLKAINVSPTTVVDVRLDLSGPFAVVEVCHTVPASVNGLITTWLEQYDVVRRPDPQD